MPEQTFSFGCCQKGAPIRESELPKLPPRAVQVILKASRERGMDGDDIDFESPEGAGLLVSLSVDMVYLTLRRIDRSVRKEELDEYEDTDEVLACFKAIQKRNPTFFEKKDTKEGASTDAPADPTSEHSEPAESATAPSEN